MPTAIAEKTTDASIVRDELLAIQAANADGLLLPDDVIEAAKCQTSPLHSKFEWDDTKAGYAHRLWQARQLISVTISYRSSIQRNVPVFVSLKKDRIEGGYRAMATVLSDAELRAELLQDARADMLVFRKKYHDLQELAGVFAAMDAV